MWLTNLYKLSISAILLSIGSLGYAQTFSIISDTTVTSLTSNIFVVGSEYLTSSTGYDTIGTSIIRPLIVQKYSEEGQLISHHTYWDSLNLSTPLFDANVIINDNTVAFAGNRYHSNNPQEYCLLMYLDWNGDTLYSNNYNSPNYNPAFTQTNWIRPTALAINETNEDMYIVSQVVDYPPIQNNFIIRKINQQGEILWTYVNPINPNYYLCNTAQVFNGKLWFNITGFYNRLQSLDTETGILLDDILLDGQGNNIIQANDAIIDENGVVVAAIGFDDDFETIPLIYRMDFLGNLIWQAQPQGTYGFDQENNHLVQTIDGGFISCGEKYDEQPSWLYPNDPAMNNTMKRIWLWKVDENGNFLWQRFYAYYDFDYSDQYFHLTNVAHDMKATPDGGVIMAGEASASCIDYPECNQFTQQGWLLKVDECGCLVPGCDPNCIVGIDEEEKNNTSFFRFGPNPVEDVLNLYLSPIGNEVLNNAVLNFYDLTGSLVKSVTLPYGNTTYIINAATLASGQYFINLSNNGRILQSEKLVKK